MDFFRSADMDLYEISVPKDNAWEILDVLGELEICHILDLNKDQQVFTLVYANRLRRVNESLRMLNTILEDEAKKLNLKMVIPNDVKGLRNTLKKQTRFKNRSPQAVFEIIEEEIKKHCKLIGDQKEREEQMHHQALSLFEEKAVLKVVAKLLGQQQDINDEEKKYDVDLRDNEDDFDAHEQLIQSSELKVTHLAGTINQQEKNRMQRMIFRATRGTAMTYFQDIERPFIDYNGTKSYKTVFVIIFQEGEYYREKLTRVIESFLAHKVDISDQDFTKRQGELNNKVKELRKVMKTCFGEVDGYIKAINTLEGSQVSKIQLYKMFLLKEKILYENLNKMKLGKKFFVGAFWLPTAETGTLREKIRELQINKQIKSPQIFRRVDHSITPPTYIRVNEFTAAFQEITDTYGIPMYKEVNPSYFAIVTFPFLFGVMFGDIGHGTLLFLFACFLCLQSNFLSRGSMKGFVPYRYLLLLMGLFAMF